MKNIFFGGLIFYIFINISPKVFCLGHSQNECCFNNMSRNYNYSFKTIRISLDYEDYNAGYSSYFDKSFILRSCYESVENTKFTLVNTTGISVDISFHCIIGIMKTESGYCGAISYIIILNYLNHVFKSIGPSILINYSNIDDLQDDIIKNIRNQIYYLNEDLNQ